MFYYKLAKEYTFEAQNLKNYISKLRKLYAKELALNDASICRRVSTLYDMYLDLKYTGDFLHIRSEFENGKIH